MAVQPLSCSGFNQRLVLWCVLCGYLLLLHDTSLVVSFQLNHMEQRLLHSLIQMRLFRVKLVEFMHEKLSLPILTFFIMEQQHKKKLFRRHRRRRREAVADEVPYHKNAQISSLESNSTMNQTSTTSSSLQHIKFK